MPMCIFVSVCVPYMGSNPSNYNAMFLVVKINMKHSCELKNGNNGRMHMLMRLNKILKVKIPPKIRIENIYSLCEVHIVSSWYLIKWPVIYSALRFDITLLSAMVFCRHWLYRVLI